MVTGRRECAGARQGRHLAGQKMVRIWDHVTQKRCNLIPKPSL
jgi:hypothetical protein